MMKKNKRIIATLLSALLAFGTVGSLAACGGMGGTGEKIDEKTIDYFYEIGYNRIVRLCEQLF